MEEDTILKVKYAEVSKFKSIYSSGQQIYLSHDGSHVICGKAGEDGVDIQIVDKETQTSTVLDIGGEIVVNFVVSHHRPTLFLATKSSLLQMWDWKLKKVLRCWKSGHRHLVSCMAVSSKGDRLVTGSSDRRLRLWRLTPDSESGGASAHLLHVCQAGADMPILTRFHSTRHLLVSVTRAEAALRVWNSDSGVQAAHLTGHAGEVTAVDFGDTVMVSCCQGKLLLVWSLDKMERLFAVPTQERLTSCVFVADPVVYLKKAEGGPYVLTGGETGVVRLWRIDRTSCALEIRRAGLNLDKTKAMEDDKEEEGDYSLKSVVRMVSGSGSHHLVVRASASIEFLRKDAVKVDREWIADVGDVRRAVLCGPDQDCLAVMPAGSSQLLLYPHLLSPASPTASWSGLTVDTGHSQPLTDLAVSRDGHRLLTASKDKLLRLWVLRRPPQGGPVTGLRLLGQAEGHTGHVTAAVFDADGAAAISAGEEVDLRLWRLPGTKEKPGGEEEVVDLKPLTVVPNAHRQVINCIAVGPKGRQVATCSKDKTIKVWALSGKSLKETAQLAGHSRGVWTVAFAPQIQRLLSSSGDGTVRLWSLVDFQCVATFENDGGPMYQAVPISNDQQFISSDQSGRLMLTTVKGQHVLQKATEHGGRVWSVCVNRDESQLVTASELGEMVLWKDVSEEERAAKQKELMETLAVEDKMRTLLNSGKLDRALQLVVRADRPMQAYKVVRDLRLERPEALASAVDVLAAHPPDLMRLLRYCVAWNSHNRRFLEAKAVLGHVLAVHRPERLAAMAAAGGEEPGRLFGAFVPHLQRHRRREARFARAALFAPYLTAAAAGPVLRLSGEAGRGEGTP